MHLEIVVTIIFIITYAVMAFGHIPSTRLGRTETAIIAAIILLATGSLSLKGIINAIEAPTLIILFVLMLISAELNIAHFYDWCAAHITNHKGSSSYLLFLVILVAGLLSALLANDIIAFAMTPILCKGIQRRNLDPRPFLFGLAGACNAGSTATIIGNPQNIFIAEKGHLHFFAFLIVCGPPAAFALAFVLIFTWLMWRKKLKHNPIRKYSLTPKVNRQETQIGIIAIILLVALFLTPIPRIYSAATIAIILLILQFKHIKSLLITIDWRLLLLFLGLFIVNASLENTGILSGGITWLETHRFTLDNLSVLTPFAFFATNIIGNVPTVIMALTLWPPHQTESLYALAIMTTLSGNAFLFGSLANIIVAERAKKVGVKISLIDHLKAGLPMTLFSIATAWFWLYVRSV